MSWTVSKGQEHFIVLCAFLKVTDPITEMKKGVVYKKNLTSQLVFYSYEIRIHAIQIEKKTYFRAVWMK